MSNSRRTGLVLLGLAAVAIIPYLRALGLPLIADDYVQIWLGRRFGPVDGWPALAADALYRCRATSLVLTYWTERIFGLHTGVFNWSSVILHVCNTWLVFALGFWRPVGWRLAALAAAFFAVYEGHQEAVIWYAALPELLVFFFTLAAFVFWTLWVQSDGRRWRYYAAALAAFLLALLSKESSVILAGLALLPVWTERIHWRRWLAPWAVFVGLVGVYTALIFGGRANHLHFHDGTFSLSGPFLLVLANSSARLFWFWGWLALLVVLLRAPARWRKLLMLAGAWVAITFLPYSFLTYMPRVPSRHTYFASVGLAWVIGAAAVVIHERWHARHRWAPYVLAAVLLVQNCVYLWTRKHQQYLVRAAPTEELIKFARKASGPVYLHCFPYDPAVGQWAVEMRLGKQVLTRISDARAVQLNGAVFCFPKKHKIAGEVSH